jgi:hypothetical protein
MVISHMLSFLPCVCYFASVDYCNCTDSDAFHAASNKRPPMDIVTDECGTSSRSSCSTAGVVPTVWQGGLQLSVSGEPLPLPLLLAQPRMQLRVCLSTYIHIIPDAINDVQ